MLVVGSLRTFEVPVLLNNIFIVELVNDDVVDLAFSVFLGVAVQND